MIVNAKIEIANTVRRRTKCKMVVKKYALLTKVARCALAPLTNRNSRLRRD